MLTQAIERKAAQPRVHAPVNKHTHRAIDIGIQRASGAAARRATTGIGHDSRHDTPARAGAELQVSSQIKEKPSTASPDPAERVARAFGQIWELQKNNTLIAT